MGHTACAASDGAAWTWGEGEEGQLGHGHELQRWRPTRIGKEMFGGLSVVLIACGSQHTTVLTVGGSVFTCGYGDCGALGLGVRENRMVMSHVTAG